MNEVISHLLTLLAGTVVGGLGKTIQDWYARKRETRAVAAALEAEISTLVDSLRRAGYLEMIDRIIAHLSEPEHVVQADDYLDAPASLTPFQVLQHTARRSDCLVILSGPWSRPINWPRPWRWI